MGKKVEGGKKESNKIAKSNWVSVIEKSSPRKQELILFSLCSVGDLRTLLITNNLDHHLM